MNSSVHCTVLFDSGSDRSYVSAELVKKVGFPWSGGEEVSYATFGGFKSGTQTRNKYELRLSSA